MVFFSMVNSVRIFFSISGERLREGVLLVLDREMPRIFSIVLQEQKKSSLFNSQDLLEIFSLHLVL
jgi:hypothetical protein